MFEESANLYLELLWIKPLFNKLLNKVMLVVYGDTAV